MKILIKTLSLSVFSAITMNVCAQRSLVDTVEQITTPRHLYLDVHRLTPGKVNPSALAQAHTKDLIVEGKYNVQILKYWADLDKGMVFCLASAPDSGALRKTHAEAHGLLPERILEVTDGVEAPFTGKKNLYLDIHYLGAGKVSASDVAGAHQKDLAVEKKYGVNLINYWLDEKQGIVMCLAEAKDSSALIKTHKEAHGLVPDHVFKVSQGE